MPRGTKKPRSVTDHSASPPALLGALQAWLGGSKDLSRVLGDLTEDWKGYPKADQLMKHLPLAKAVALKCPSLLPRPKNFQRALEKLDAEHGPVNFTGKDRTKWADDIGGIMRSLFSKYRRLLEKPVFQRVWNQLSRVEEDKLMELVQIMAGDAQVPVPEEPDEGEDGGLAGGLGAGAGGEGAEDAEDD